MSQLLKPVWAQPQLLTVINAITWRNDVIWQLIIIQPYSLSARLEECVLVLSRPLWQINHNNLAVQDILMSPVGMKEDLSWSLFSQHIIDHLWLSNHENYDKYSVNVKNKPINFIATFWQFINSANSFFCLFILWRKSTKVVRSSPDSRKGVGWKNSEAEVELMSAFSPPLSASHLTLHTLPVLSSFTSRHPLLTVWRCLRFKWCDVSSGFSSACVFILIDIEGQEEKILNTSNRQLCLNMWYLPMRLKHRSYLGCTVDGAKKTCP